MAHAKPNSDSSRLLRGEILRRWEQLSNSDLEESGANRSKLIELLQSRYGYARRRAEKEVELFLGDFRNRLRMTA